MRCRALVGGDQRDQTCFELDSDSGIILDLFDHLSVPADDNTDRKPGHCHLEGTHHTHGALSGGELRSVLIHAQVCVSLAKYRPGLFSHRLFFFFFFGDRKSVV